MSTLRDPGCPCARTVATLALVLALAACADLPRGEEPRVPDPGFVGSIHPEGKAVSVGEDLLVEYRLRSLAPDPLRVEIEEASRDAGRPFHNYSFNAALKDSPAVPLELVFLGQPPLGPQTLQPNTPFVFQRIRWRAREPGLYRLTFVLEWRAGQLVTFEETLVEVAGRPTPTERTPVEVKPEVVEQVKALVAEMGLHLEPGEWRKREEIKTRIKRLGPAASLPLIEDLGHARERVRMEVMNLLIEIGRPALPALLRGLRHASSLIRYRSAFALGKIRSELVSEASRAEVDPLVTSDLAELAKKDADLQVRYLSLTVLARYFKPADAVPVLLDGLSDPALEIRQAANRSLREILAADVGYNPAAPEAERKAGAERWRAQAAGKAGSEPDSDWYE